MPPLSFPQDKRALVERGRLRMTRFCEENSAVAPELVVVPKEEWYVSACAYYRPQTIRICLEDCQHPCSEAANRNWSWPGNTVDREPYGVVAHELGHHFDWLTGESPPERFLYWIQERELMRLRREADLPPPWTDDEILQTYRFCNVRRMDDRVSKWLLENWYEPNFGHSNMVLAVCLARFLNLPDSLAAISYPFRWRKEWMKQTLRARAEKGLTNFNGAYMVRGNDGVDKVSSVLDFYVGPLAQEGNRLEVEPDSMRITWMRLYPYYGFGSFMAGQVVADLRWALPGGWKDRNEWAPLGPGSRRGMNRLYGRDVNAPLSQERFLGELQDTIEMCKERLPESITHRLEAMDYQSVLCETDKFSRALLGEGRPKQLYRSKR